MIEGGFDKDKYDGIPFFKTVLLPVAALSTV